MENEEIVRTRRWHKKAFCPQLRKFCFSKKCGKNSLTSLSLLTPCAFHKYFKRVGESFGWKFVGMLLSCYVALKGCVHTFLTRVELPYYRSLGFDGIAYQSAVAVSTSPWAMKGAIGALSDGVPLFGYYKTPYIAITSLVGTVSFIALAITPQNIAQIFTWLPPILFFFANLEISTIDLLCEGKYAELMADKPQNGLDIVTFVWMSIMIGKIFGSALVGPLSDYVGTYIIFIISAPLSAQILIPTLLGWLPEKRKKPWKIVALESVKILKEVRLFILSILITCGTLGFVVIALVLTSIGQFIYVVAWSFVLCISTFFCMSRIMALCSLYIFLQEAFHPSILGALDFWYTAPQTCVPGGPSFSYTYYSTWSGLIGILAAFVGIFLFQVVVSKWTFRRALLVTTIVRLAASVFDMIIVLRWNLAIGIPDQVMYLFGDAIIQDIVVMLNFMPIIALTSKLCPKGVESTMYAILAGFNNFGGVVSRSIGIFAINIAHIETKEPCNFENLPFLIFVCHVCFPLLVIPLTFFLLPDARMSDSILPEDLPGHSRQDCSEIESHEDVLESLSNESCVAPHAILSASSRMVSGSISNSFSGENEGIEKIESGFLSNSLSGAELEDAIVASDIRGISSDATQSTIEQIAGDAA